MSLRKALHHKTCLVLRHRPVLIPLHLEPVLHPDWLATMWEINEALGVILLDGCHFLHHRLSPAWTALSLGEVGQHVRDHHM
jgi:hypothetical protein